jgi:ABC-type multidrug transport system ATPase subunit
MTLTGCARRPLRMTSLVTEIVSLRGCSVWLRRVSVLQGIDLHVGTGEVVGIVGANGSGKSTLLRVIVGLLRPQEGEIRLFGQPPFAADVLRRVGASIDTPALYPWMSGRGVLRTLLDLSGEADRGRAVAALTRFDLATVGRKPVIRYSQGMRKRLALAAAAMRDPELLILDEPTNALDAEGRATVVGWIAERRDAGGAVIIATHRAGDAQLCDRVLRLEDATLQPTLASEWAQDPGAQV